MLAIQIGDEYLDLLPDTSIELLEENPFLQFAEDQVVGNYSFPFELLNTEKNMRLLNYASLLQQRVDNTGIPAKLYSNGLQHSAGLLKIERIPINLNRAASSRISCYYLSGSSSFFQDIKGKQLRDIDLGGDRSYAWDLGNPLGSGFWGHITSVIRAADPQVFDYCFFPVKNPAWEATLKFNPPIMNHMYLSGGNVCFTEVYSNHAINPIVPFPWLHYVLKKAVESVGWTISGEILSDPDFLKICMINFQAINWAQYDNRFGTFRLPMDPVVFDLADHLPEITIPDFLAALRKRFGWWYDYDLINKKITINKIYTAAVSEIKNFTARSSALITKAMNNEKKIYALRNRFYTDLSNGSPLFKIGDIKGGVDEVADLPAVTETIYSHIYLVRRENSYYICTYNEDGSSLIWDFYAYNIYDYEPAGVTDEIVTEATTVGMEKGNDSYLHLVPTVGFSGNWMGQSESAANWGVILCFYHGRVNNNSGAPYCYGSPHIYDPNLNQVAQWGLPFYCEKTDGSDVGLYERNWKPFLQVLSSAEQLEATLYLPLHEMLQLKFSDRISINNVNMFIKQVKKQLPYKGELKIEAVRII